MPPPGKKKVWEDKLLRSGFFFGALLFHLLVFLIVATWVVFSAPPIQPDDPHSFPPPVAVNPPPAPTISPAAPAIASSAVAPVPVVPTVASNLVFRLLKKPVDVAGPDAFAPPSPPKNLPGKTGIPLDRLKKFMTPFSSIGPRRRSPPATLRPPFRFTLPLTPTATGPATFISTRTATSLRAAFPISRRRSRNGARVASKERSRRNRSISAGPSFWTRCRLLSSSPATRTSS